MTNPIEASDLLQAIATLEAQRPTLGDTVVDASVGALRKQLADLSAAPPDEQRKLVTVLFADLAGWTAMSEHMDPEEVREIQDAYFAAVTKPIEAYGGSVEKYIGDAVLAVFGVPQAHEDDAERAVHAALAMQDAMTGLNHRLEASTAQTSATPSSENSPLRLRIGVNTGLVVSRVDEGGDFIVTGDMVNLASRLQSAAEPGTVLVSADTHKLAAHAFETVDLGAVPVKGKAEPVQVFRVAGVAATPAKLRGVAGLDSPLVGRQGEMAALREALDRLERGVGGIVTVVGEAGIGKSRLVAELRKARQLTDHPSLQSASLPDFVLTGNWIEGRCLSFGAAIPYLLWLDVLRNALGVTLNDPPEVVAERLRSWVQGLCPERFAAVYPYLARLMSLSLEAETLADLAELDGQALKQRTFQAAENALTCAANRHPLTIVLEDLHWADPSSLELLQYLLPLVDRTSMLLVCIFRPHVDHGSWQFRDLVGRDFRHRYTDLWLQPLSAVDSEALVGNLLRVDALPQALRWRILSRAEGNPFFVEEVIRTLIDIQAIAYDPASSRWLATRDLAEVPIPETLQGVIAARIDRLHGDTRHVLQLASVVGRIFLYRVLAALAEKERDLEGQLVTLQREELIRERARIPELEYIFKHELTREAAYHGILKRQRKLFHRQVAEALERLFPDHVEEHLGLLGYHWELAGAVEKAVSYLLRAAQRDVRRYANQEAIAHYMRGLTLLDSLPESPERDQNEFAMQMGLGTSLIAIRGYGAPEIAHAWGRALDLSQRMGDPPQLWPARSALSQYYLVRAEHETASEIARQMAEAGAREGDTPLFPFPTGALGISCFYRGDFESARHNLEAMVACYNRERHHTSAYVYGQDLGVLYLSYLAWVLWFLGHVDEARKRSREALALAEALDHPFTLALASGLAGRLHSSCRDVASVQRLASATAAIALERNFAFYQAVALGLQGWANVELGAIEQGEEEIRRSMDIWHATGARFHRAHFFAWLAEAAARRGRNQEALDLLAEASTLIELTGERYYEAEVIRLAGVLRLKQGDEDAAETAFDRAIVIARQQSARSLELRAALSLVRLWQSQGRRFEARRHLSEVYGWFTEGLDIPDLEEARVLLDELAPP